MSTGKSIFITGYGHNNAIEKIAISLFDNFDFGYKKSESNAEIYCDTINKLKLEGESWVFAQIISENTQYQLNALLPLTFDVILEMHDLSIQRLLRECNPQELAKALKGEKEAIKEKVFSNLSKRAAQMLKEDIECMGPLGINDVIEAQKKIIRIICLLEQTGEIINSRLKGEAVK
jgi:flagellar motor switch protein FliG